MRERERERERERGRQRAWSDSRTINRSIWNGQIFNFDFVDTTCMRRVVVVSLLPRLRLQRISQPDSLITAAKRTIPEVKTPLSLSHSFSLSLSLLLSLYLSIAHHFFIYHIVSNTYVTQVYYLNKLKHSFYLYTRPFLYLSREHFSLGGGGKYNCMDGPQF